MLIGIIKDKMHHDPLEEIYSFYGSDDEPKRTKVIDITEEVNIEMQKQIPLNGKQAVINMILEAQGDRK